MAVCNAKANLDLPNKVSAYHNTTAKTGQVDHILKSEMSKPVYSSFYCSYQPL